MIRKEINIYISRRSQANKGNDKRNEAECEKESEGRDDDTLKFKQYGIHKNWVRT